MEGEVAAVERKLVDVQVSASEEIRRLKRYIDESDALLQEFIDDASYVDISDVRSAHKLYKCGQCETSKGAQHAVECVVGKAEAFLRHWEA